MNELFNAAIFSIFICVLSLSRVVIRYYLLMMSVLLPFDDEYKAQFSQTKSRRFAYEYPISKPFSRKNAKHIRANFNFTNSICTFVIGSSLFSFLKNNLQFQPCTNCLRFITSSCMSSSYHITYSHDDQPLVPTIAIFEH